MSIRSCFAGLLNLVFLSAVSMTDLRAGADSPEADPEAAAAERHSNSAGVEYFEKFVRPLLIRHCYECHSDGDQKQKGGLRLDVRAGWQAGGDSGPAVIPGKPDESLLISAVKYESYEMPPRGRLSDGDVRILEKWVAMGAPDPRDGEIVPAGSSVDVAAARDFWAFRPPRKSVVPTVHREDWAQSDIDRYVLSQLEAHQLQPVEDAGRREWLRRVSFDLTGLPPTVGEMAAFLADTSGIARATVVDRLLASPRFGEHWARHWLDLARYADSNGGDINLTYFNAWKYRDYVVSAFNTDKPFDEFVREQIAGDLLPADSVERAAEQLTATGFLMVGPKMLSERNKEKLHMDVVDEQLDTIGRVFMGLTIGCARCHDHKFDPIPARDYYAMAGILRSTETVHGIRMNNVNVSGWLERPVPLPEDVRKKIEAADMKISSASDRLKRLQAELKEITSTTTPRAEELPGIVVDDTDAERVGNWTASTYTKRYVGAGYIHDNREDRGAKSVTFRPLIPEDGRYEVRITYASGKGRATNVPVTVSCADGEFLSTVNQEKLPEGGGLFHTLGRFQFRQGRAGFVRISNQSADGYVIVDAAQFVPVTEADQAQAFKDESPAVAERRAALTKEIRELESRLKKLREEAPDQPMVMAAADRDEVGDTALRIRGLADQRGEIVPRGFLSLASFETPPVKPSSSGRAELADWLTDRRNPLTARVFVNRVWMHLMGEGIVRSVDNFGRLGERPTHPELLDRLAVDFMESGWSVKQLVRRICLTRTYGLSTRIETGHVDVDPENRLMWRQNRRRLSAEEIRDAMLAVSGRLRTVPGGSSVSGLSEQAVNNSSRAKSSWEHESTDRRSLYLPIIRNDLPPMLSVFDFADPDVVTGKRSVTNVPAQALLMLNSRFVSDCARSLADELLRALPAGSAAERIQWLYERMLGRTPEEDEILLASRFLRAAGVAPVEKETPGDSGVEDGVTDDVAWQKLIHSIFASSEFRMLD